jgi:hypothetical protein
MITPLIDGMLTILNFPFSSCFHGLEKWMPVQAFFYLILKDKKKTEKNNFPETAE